MQANRDKAGHFLKGVSGNPNGRPKIPDDVKRMLKEASLDATKLLIDTIADESANISYRLDAAKEVLNRVYGKSTQPIDGEIDAAIRVMLSGEAEDYAK